MTRLALGADCVFGKRPQSERSAAGVTGRYGAETAKRWALGLVLAGAVALIVSDLYTLAREGGWWDQPEFVRQQVSVPVIVTARDDRALAAPDAAGDSARGPLDRPLRFTLERGGVLLARGTIDEGAAGRFIEEIAALGRRITTIALDSPGGSLDDAMAMATVIRRNNLRTQVPDGAICASSCPLVLAGGVSRTVGHNATVAVHQFYAGRGTRLAPDQAMADAQSTAARIARHLNGLGVDSALWLHALDTPPQSLYRLSLEQMSLYRMVTGPLHAAQSG